MQIKPVRDESVVAGDLTFHYLQWGEQGPPIIFVHGITASNTKYTTGVMDQ